MVLWRLACAVLLMNALLLRLNYPFSFTLQIPSWSTISVGLSWDVHGFSFRHFVAAAGRTNSSGVIY